MRKFFKGCALIFMCYRGAHANQLTAAARDCNLEIVRNLVDRGDDVNGLDANKTALDFSLDQIISSKNSSLLRPKIVKCKEIANFLKEKGALTATVIQRQQRLAEAAAAGKLDVIRTLVEKEGAKINFKNSDGKTTLDLALQNNQELVAHYLLNQGEKLLPRDRKRLFAAARLGNIQLLQEVLLNGLVDMNCRDSQGYTPLDVATKAGKKDLVKWLQDRNAISGQKLALNSTNTISSCLVQSKFEENLLGQNADISRIAQVINGASQVEPLQDRVREKELQVKRLSPRWGVFNADGSRQARAGVVDGQKKDFLTYHNQGDGDCALWGMRVDNSNINRADFVRKLLEGIEGFSPESRQLRALIYPDVQSWCLQEREPSGEVGLDVKSMPLFIEYVTTRLADGAYLAYFRDNSGTFGSLAAAAKIYGMNIRVWRDEPGIPFYLSAVIKNNSTSQEYVDLYHRNLNHYDLLVEGGDLARRNRALDKEIFELTRRKE